MLGPLVFAVAYIAQAGWAADLWPFETSRLTNLFIGSILVAIAVPTAWIGATREWGALRATAIFPALMLGAMAVFLIARELGDDSGLVGHAIVFAIGAAYAVVLVLVGSRVPLRDTRAAPAVVRASFAIFAAVLILAGGLLVAGADNVLPWVVDEDAGVMVGFVFLGAASSYAFGVVRPMWGYVAPPLIGFLAYDLVLVWPLVDHFSDVIDEQRTSLVIYVVVVAYSALLAAYYLLVKAGTRIRLRG